MYIIFDCSTETYIGGNPKHKKHYWVRTRNKARKFADEQAAKDFLQSQGILDFFPEDFKIIPENPEP